MLKAEKVVNPPQNPTIRSARRWLWVWMFMNWRMRIPIRKAAGDVHEQGAERESMRSEVLDSAANQIAEHGTCGASNCDE